MSPGMTISYPRQTRTVKGVPIRAPESSRPQGGAGAFSSGFHVPVERGRSGGVEVAICDLKDRPWWPSVRTLCFHRKALPAKLDELDRRVSGHDETIRSLVQVIRQLMDPSRAPSSGLPEKPRRSIGFKVE